MVESLPDSRRWPTRGRDELSVFLRLPLELLFATRILVLNRALALTRLRVLLRLLSLSHMLTLGLTDRA